MSAMFVLIIASLLIALGFLGAFLWAVKSGQYDDKYTPSVRILLDDEPEEKEPAASSKKPQSNYHTS
ncbi:MAG: cbb3-type cytochrome oxidase assembly protein CcoS [Calditrichaeota bacterium]|nr:cbb3-type cytochrome oxidase assembly protein CcoS [Calditrichota bacterium]MCB0291317.1 cbb3-type cytochrome oxidase assembly protein CcoS [Calditrichota bacterium]MCB0304945.1 cbb3-type cytochrome oxidase assembly protein CcoS [Calditrichota bacterium]MCB0316491.1 cbb3-type cytochrome oxidase assembly protein CcoS [Calditrichota bacterium]MCB9088069.1 cbb3-type cytochrome oxidase assembly protein CcoS [Calditrichia bacterium]